jgi:hypothetical protein
MAPGNPLVVAANTALADPNFRASLRQMHAEGYPLVKIVEALGLEEDMTDRIRTILEGLPAKVVEDIRRATVEMLNSGVYEISVDCSLSGPEIEGGTPIDLDVESAAGREMIQIRPRTVTAAQQNQ